MGLSHFVLLFFGFLDLFAPGILRGLFAFRPFVLWFFGSFCTTPEGLFTFRIVILGSLV